MFKSEGRFFIAEFDGKKHHLRKPTMRDKHRYQKEAHAFSKKKKKRTEDENVAYSISIFRQHYCDKDGNCICKTDDEVWDDPYAGALIDDGIVNLMRHLQPSMEELDDIKKPSSKTQKGGS